MARRDNLRNNRRDVHAVYVFSRNSDRRRGGNDRNLLCMSRNGRDVGKFLSQKISKARRNNCSDFGDERRLFTRDGRQSDKITRSNGLRDMEFVERRGICIQRDIPKTFICKKN